MRQQGVEMTDSKEDLAKFTTKNAVVLNKLLRVRAASAYAKEHGLDTLYLAAADIAAMNVEIMKVLEDVPGETAIERVQRLKDWYVELYNGLVEEVERRDVLLTALGG
jgi:hypothetical protein